MSQQRWYGELGNYLGVLVPTVIGGLLLFLQMIGVWQLAPWQLTLIMTLGFGISFALTVRHLQQRIEGLQAQLDKPQVEIANPTALNISLANWLNVYQGRYQTTFNTALAVEAEFKIIYRGVSPANAELRYGGLDIDWQAQSQPTTVVPVFEADGSTLPDGRLILVPNAVPRVRATVIMNVPSPWFKGSLARYSGLTYARLHLEVEVEGKVYRSSVSYDVAGLRGSLVRAVLSELIKITQGEGDAEKLAFAVGAATEAVVALCVPPRQSDNTDPDG